jgi:hypothetical protein
MANNFEVLTETANHWLGKHAVEALEPVETPRGMRLPFRIDDLPPMMVDSSILDSFTGPIQPGELRLVDCDMRDLSKLFYRIPQEIPEEDFIRSVCR